MSEIKKNNDEEVDLGSLFVIIGNGISKVNKAIKNTINSVFIAIIKSLLFLKKNFLKIIIGCVLGGIVGLIIELNENKKYEATLHLKPNFDSSRQLYNSIKFYNDLVKQKNYTLLQQTFDISEEEAKSLKKFEIEPVINENDIVYAFDRLVKGVDTTAVKNYSYSKFKTMFTKYDYRFQKVLVISTKSDIFTKLTKAIIGSITENDYFRRIKNTTTENLTRTNKLINKNIAQSDSLHKIYKKVLITEAKKENTGTSIDMGSSKSSNKEILLFETNRQLNKDLDKISREISEKTEIVNIISDFQPVGHKITEIKKNKIFQLGIIGGILTVFILILIKINHFLESYK